MVSFKSNTSEINRLDYELLQNGFINLEIDEKVLAEHLNWFKKQKYRIILLDTDKWVDESVFHENVMEAFRFPDYYGKNLNAFSECLRSAEVPDKAGMLIVLNNFDRFYSRRQEYYTVSV